MFEGYGPIGERRTHDLGGKPVDDSTEFPGGIAGMVCDITFPATRFATPVFVPGAALVTALVDVNTSIAGTLRISVASALLALPAGSVHLGTLRLRPRSFGSVPLTAPLDLSVSGLSDDAGNPITAGLLTERSSS